MPQGVADKDLLQDVYLFRGGRADLLDLLPSQLVRRAGAAMADGGAWAGTGAYERGGGAAAL
ncbi:hypothetical protein CRUP_020215, partial [Coryphaenoides rupestris]